MSREGEQVKGYVQTIALIEPEISMIGRDAALASIAISLKRIADALSMCDKYGLTGAASVAQAIMDGMREGRS